VFTPHMKSSNATLPLNVFSHMANVNRAEYFMVDAYVRVAMVMASAGTLLQM